MTENIVFRKMQLEDYEQVISLWEESNLNVERQGLDSYNAIKKVIQASPQLNFVAEKNKIIVGAIIGTYDYRKGYLHRLAVKKECRQQGVATKLMSLAEEELIKIGAKRIDALIYKNNPVSKKFLKKMGFEPAHNVLYLTKSKKK